MERKLKHVWIVFLFRLVCLIGEILMMIWLLLNLLPLIFMKKYRNKAVDNFMVDFHSRSKGK